MTSIPFSLLGHLPPSATLAPLFCLEHVKLTLGHEASRRGCLCCSVACTVFWPYPALGSSKWGGVEAGSNSSVSFTDPDDTDWSLLPNRLRNSSVVEHCLAYPRPGLDSWFNKQTCLLPILTHKNIHINYTWEGGCLSCTTISRVPLSVSGQSLAVWERRGSYSNVVPEAKSVKTAEQTFKERCKLIKVLKQTRKCLFNWWLSDLCGRPHLQGSLYLTWLETQPVPITFPQKHLFEDRTTV